MFVIDLVYGWEKWFTHTSPFECVSLPVFVCLVLSNFPRSGMTLWIPQLRISGFQHVGIFSPYCVSVLS